MAKQLNVNLSVSADVEKAKAAINSLSQALHKVAATPIELGDAGAKELQAASEAAISLQKHLQAAVNVNTGKLDLARFNTSLMSSNQKLSQLQSTLLASGTEGQQAFLKLSQAIATADVPTTRINKHLAEMGTVLKNTIRWQISSSAIHAFMGAIQSAYGYAEDLNKSLNNIRIVTGASTEEMSKFAEEASKAARVLNTTTKDYTDAALIYFQQGLKGKDVTDRTDVTTKLANVSRQSAEEVSSQLTAIWNNFADGSKELEYYADVITKLGASTAASSEEISTGIEKFAAVADTVGLSYEKATAALATVVAETRQSADVVGTAFKTMFARVQGLSLGETLEDGVTLNKYSKALATVGVNILDANGELKKMDNILDELGNRWNTISEAQKVALAETVAGTRQYAQFMAIMNNYDKILSNQSLAAGSSGALQEQADIYAQSWEAARKSVQQSLNDIYKELVNDQFFTAFDNNLAKGLDGINGLIKGLGGINGLLTTAASIFMTYFANRMPTVLHEISLTTQQFLGIAQAKTNELQQENLSLLNTYKEQANNNSLAFGIQIAGLQKVAIMGNSLLNNSARMTQQEKEEYEMRMQLVQSMHDQLVIEAQTIDKQTAANQKIINDLSEIKNLREALNQNSEQTDYAVQLWRTQDALSNLISAYKEWTDYKSKKLGLSIPINQENIDKAKELEQTYKTLADEWQSTIRVFEDKSGNVFKIQINDIKAMDNALKELNKGTISIRTPLQQLGASFKILGKDNPLEGLSKVGKDDLPVAKKAVKELGQELSKLITNSTKIKEVSSAFQNLDKQGLDGFKTSLTLLRDQLQNEIPEAFNSTKISLNDVISAIEQGDSINHIKTMFQQWSQEILATNGILNQSQSTIITFFEMMGADADTLDALKNGSIEAGEGIGILLKKMGFLGGMADQSASHVYHLSEALMSVSSMLMSLNSIMNSFKRISEVFTDKDASAVEKIGAVIGALTTIIFAFNAAQRMRATVTGLVKQATDKDTAAQNKYTISAFIATAQTERLAAAFKNLYASMGPLGVILLAISAILMLLAAAIGTVASAREREIEYAKEQAESAIETADSLKEETDSVEKLVTTYRQAYKTFSDTEEGKEELEDAILAVAEALKIENAELMIQQGLYEQLNKDIEAAYAKKVEEALIQNGIAQTKQTTVFENAMREDLGHKQGDNYIVSGKLTDNMAFGTVYNQNSDAYKTLKINEYTNDYNNETKFNWTINTELDEQGLIQAYEEVQDYIQKMNVYAQEHGITVDTDPMYKQMAEWLNKSNDAYTKLKELKDAGIDLTIQQDAMQLIKESDINSLEEYNTLLDQLTQTLVDSKTFPDADEAREAATAYLQLNSATSEYANTAKQLQGLSKQTGISIDTLTSSFYNSLDDDDKKLMFYLQPDMFKSKQLFDSGIKELKFKAENEEIQVKIDTYTEAQKNWKKNLSSEQMKDFETSSKIDWGNEAIQYSDFLKMEYGEQQAYLKNLENEERAHQRQNNENLKVEKENQLNYFKAVKQRYEEQLKNGERITSEDTKNYNNAINKIKEIGNEIEQIQDEIDIGIVLETSDFSNQLNTLMSSDYQIGTTLTIEETEALSKLGLDLNEILTPNGDGTYSLIISGIELQDQIKDAALEKLTELAGLKKQSGELSAEDDTLFSNLKQFSLDNLSKFEDLNNLMKTGAIDLQEYAAAYEKLDAAMDLKNVDSKELLDYSKYLQKAAKNSELLDNSLEENDEAAKIVAKSILKMNSGVEKLSKGFKGWSDVLKKSDKSSQEYFSSLEDLRDACSDLLDINGESLSEAFLTDAKNMALMEKAATGDAQAIDDLRAAAAQQIFLDIAIANLDEDKISGFMEQVAALQQQIPDLEIGAVLDGDDSFVQACNELIQQAGMTVEQANAAFDALGFESNFVEEPQEVEQTVPRSVTRTTVVDYTSGTAIGPDGEPIDWSYPVLSQSTYNDGFDTQTGTVMVPALSTNDNTPTINSLTKKATGSANNNSSLNAGKAGGSGGGGSKRSAKATEPETRRYSKVENSISNLTSQYDRLGKARDRAWGLNKIKIMDQEVDKLQELGSAYQDYLKEIVGTDWGKLHKKIQSGQSLTIQDILSSGGYLSKDLQGIINGSAQIEYVKDIDKEGNQIVEKFRTGTLDNLLKIAGIEGLGIEIGGNGKITNTDDLLNAIDKYLAVQKEKWNALTATEQESSEQKAWWSRVEAIAKYFPEAIQQYNDTVDALNKNSDELQENTYAIQDAKFDIMSEKLEQKNYLADNQIKSVQYSAKILGDDIYKTVEVMSKLYDLKGNSEYQGYVNKYRNFEALYEEAKINRDENPARFLEIAKQVQEGTYEIIDSILDMNASMKEFYGTAIDKALNELEKITNQMEHHIQVMDHLKNTLSLLNKNTNYEQIKNILNGIIEMRKNSLTVSTNEYNMFKKQLDEANIKYDQMLKDGLAEGAKQYKETVLDKLVTQTAEAEQKMYENTESYLEAVNELYSITIESILKEYEEKFSGGLGYDFLIGSMDRASSIQEEYLTKTNQLYETSALLRKLNQDIDKTENIAAKTRLKNFANEIEHMQAVEKLSQNDLDIAKARYEVLLAQIALEEAQNAKSTVRLQRDSEGNYGYIYTADQDKVAEATQNVADKSNALYNLVLNKANESGKKIITLEKERDAQLAALAEEYRGAEGEKLKEYYQKKEKITQQYNDLLYAEYDNYNKSIEWVGQTAATNYTEAWITGFEDILDAGKDYEKDTETMLNKIEIAMRGEDGNGGYRGAIKEVEDSTYDLMDQTNDLVTKNQDLVDILTKDDGVIAALGNELTAIDNATEAWGRYYTKISEVIGEMKIFTGQIDNDIKPYDKNIDYEQKMIEHIMNGGTFTDEIFNNLFTQRDNKISGEGLDASYYGVRSKSEIIQDVLKKLPDYSIAIKEYIKQAGYTTLEDASADTHLSTLMKLRNEKIAANPELAKWDKTLEQFLEEVLKELTNNITSADTGIYTGEWGSTGKLALLHEKELVLNAVDTENILAAVDIIREITSAIDLRAGASSIASGLNSPSFGGLDQTLEQSVTIHAEFPNATDHAEIEEAFNNLINRATQYAARPSNITYKTPRI